MANLKIIVPVKRVIDYTVKIRVAGGKVETNNVKHSMNPFDEIAVEEAVKMKEANKAKEIVAVSIGPAKSQETLRPALAMGADRAIHVEVADADTVNPLQVAKILKGIADKEKPDLMILGKQAIDDDAAQTGPMLAGLLGWPQATFASKIQIDEAAKGATVTREIDGGMDVIQTPFPFIATTDLRLNVPRYASLPNIMKAKKKPLVKVKPSEYGVDLTPTLKIVSVAEPPTRKGGVKVDSVDALIDKLKNEAKVL
ncbi:electron transfer flavo protein, beta subunit [Caulochytrium protostelioides]|uniref:Probable electron transfer flavoprotein subunit beta n=1 Tax=Caulochytrium protostelioides TaxID=1555241 RepID=A0A4P9WY95_9FUNG|nr:electron transfer flavo protein, beta subunit [Caulochytrium protostelioides]